MTMRWEAQLEGNVADKARADADGLIAMREALNESRRALDEFNAARGRTHDGAAFSDTKFTDPIAKSPWEQMKGWKGGAIPPAPNAGGGGAKQAGEAADAVKRSTEASSKTAAKLGKDLGGVAGVYKAGVAAAVAYAGVTGGAALTQVAIGYQGVARLQAISYRASLDVRRLFTGVDAAPLVRAADRFERNLQRSTVTGNALSGILTRGFNNFFGAVERAEPYITAMGQGALIAALYVEQGMLRARLALMPYTDAIGDMIGEEDALETAAWAGGVALAAAGVAAAAALAPYILLAGAVGAVAAAFRQAVALYREWKAMSSDEQHKIVRKTLSFGLIDDDKDKGPSEGEQGVGVDAAALAERARMLDDPNAAAKAKAAGEDTGQALGQGMMRGMRSSEAAVRAAGERLAAAADQGVRDKAQIHSPSRAMEYDAEMMGAGAVRGLVRSGPAVRAAAERALVPDLRGVVGVNGGGAGAGSGNLQVVVQAEFPNVRSGARDDIRAALEEAAPFIARLVLREVAMTRGVST